MKQERKMQAKSGKASFKQKSRSINSVQIRPLGKHVDTDQHDDGRAGSELPVGMEGEHLCTSLHQYTSLRDLISFKNKASAWQQWIKGRIFKAAGSSLDADHEELDGDGDRIINKLENYNSLVWCDVSQIKLKDRLLKKAARAYLSPLLLISTNTRTTSSRRTSPLVISFLARLVEDSIRTFKNFFKAWIHSSNPASGNAVHHPYRSVTRQLPPPSLCGHHY